MEHKYQIQGMTCTGCMRTVKKALSEVPGVSNVDVDFEASTAVIQMEKHIPLTTFEETLQERKAKYHIHPYKNDETVTRTFPVNGMTCNGCKSHVETVLSKVDGVTNVSVDLEKAEATIDMTSEIAIEIFQDILKKDGGTYSIYKAGQRPAPNHEEKQK